MEVKVVSERSQTVSKVLVAVHELIATSRVHDLTAVTVTMAVLGTILFYQSGNVLHQEPVQLVWPTTACESIVKSEVL